MALKPLTTQFSVGGDGLKTLTSIKAAYEQLKLNIPKVENSNKNMFAKMKSHAQSTFSSIKNGAVSVGNAFKVMAARSEGLRPKGFGIGSKVAGVAGILGLSLGISSAVQSFQKFDDSMLKTKAISQATESEYGQLRDMTKELGRTTRFNTEEVAEALTYQAVAGWKANQMLKATPAILNLAAASGENLASVSDIVTDSMTAFGWSADKAGYFTDILAKAATSTNTSVGQMGEAFKYVAPTASVLGESIQDTATYLGILANSGLKGSMAGTSLNEVLSSLQRPTGEAGKMIKALGLNLTDTKGNFVGLTKVLPQLKKSLSGLGTSQRAAVLETIFGSRGGRAINTLLKSSNEEFSTLNKNIINSHGSTERMAKLMNGGFGGTIDNLKSAVQGFGIEFIEVFQKDLIEAMNWVSDKLNTLVPKMKKFFDDGKKFWAEWKEPILAVGGGILAAKLAFDAFLTVTGTIMAVKAGLVALTAVAAKFGITLSAAIWPVTLIVAGVAALTAGFIYLYRNTEWFPKFIKSIWEGMKSFIDNTKILGKVLWDHFLPPILAVWEVIQDIISGIKKAVEIAKNLKSDNVTSEDKYGNGYKSVTNEQYIKYKDKIGNSQATKTVHYTDNRKFEINGGDPNEVRRIVQEERELEKIAKGES